MSTLSSEQPKIRRRQTKPSNAAAAIAVQRPRSIVQVDSLPDVAETVEVKQPSRKRKMASTSVITEPAIAAIEETVIVNTEQEERGRKGSSRQEAMKRFREGYFQRFDELQAHYEKEVLEAAVAAGDKLVVKALKTGNKKLKALRKDTNKVLGPLHKKRNANNDNSGLKKPVNVTRDLALFLKQDVDTPISRCNVTSLINKYFRENNLQNPERRVEIIPDEPLRKLLNYNESDGPLTYANVHRFLKPHYL